MKLIKVIMRDKYDKAVCGGGGGREGEKIYDNELRSGT